MIAIEILLISLHQFNNSKSIFTQLFTRRFYFLCKEFYKKTRKIALEYRFRRIGNTTRMDNFKNSSTPGLN